MAFGKLKKQSQLLEKERIENIKNTEANFEVLGQSVDILHEREIKLSDGLETLYQKHQSMHDISVEVNGLVTKSLNDNPGEI